MTNNSLILVLCFLVLQACLSKNQKPLPVEPEPICRIVQLESRDADSSYNFTELFNYDSSGVLVNRIYFLHDLYYSSNQSEDAGDKTTYTYDAEGRVTETRTDDKLWSTVMYNGDLANKLDLYEVEGEDTNHYVYTFKYANEKVTEVRLIENGINRDIVFKVEYSGMNVSRIEQYDSTKLLEWHNYDEYDDTTNFFTGWIPLLYDNPIEIEDFLLYSENNPIHQNYGLGPNPSSWYLKYNYSLNSDSAIAKIVTEDHWSDVIEYNYQHDCWKP
ncbi:hypothetical protein GYB22_00375 [bacterium]|nr:hypothetical protein [bacterium]